MNDRVAELCRKLEPILPKQVKQLWAAYQADPDVASRGKIEHMLEILAQKHLALSYQPDRSPFVPPPKQWAQAGELPLGEVIYAGKKYADFNLKLDRLTEHVLVCGRSGSGKSTLTLRLSRGLMKRGVVVTAFDWKRSYRDLLHDAPSGTLRVRTPGRDLAPFFWNPLIPPPGTDPVLYAKLIVDVISRALLGGDGVISLLHRGILALYDREGVGTDQQQRWPTIHDLLTWLENTKLTGRAAMWKSSADRILRAMTFGEFGKMVDTQSNADLHALLDVHHVLELDGLAGSADRTVFAEGVTLWLSRYLLQRGECNMLERAIIHEEGHNLFKASESGSAQETVLEQSLRMARAYGVGYIIVDQTASMLSKTVFSNTGTVLALSQKLRSDVQAIAGAMNLDEAQRQAVSTLPVGTVIARVPDGHPEPFLVSIPAPEDQPHITDEQVRRASAAAVASQEPAAVTAEDEIVRMYLALTRERSEAIASQPIGEAQAILSQSNSSDSRPIHTVQSMPPPITPIPLSENNESEKRQVNVMHPQDTIQPTLPPEPSGVTIDSSKQSVDRRLAISTVTPSEQSLPPSTPGSPGNPGNPGRIHRGADAVGGDGVSQAAARRAEIHGAAVTRLLTDLVEHPLSTTVERYNRLHLSRRKGHTLRTALVEADLITPVRIPTRSGNVVLLELTPRGRQHCQGIGLTILPTGSAGTAHRYWAQRAALALQAEGYRVRHEHHVEGNGRVDLLASKDGVELPCEIETGRSSIDKNLLNGLKYFQKVLVIATCPEAVVKCRAAIDKLPAAQKRRVDLKTWLDY